MRIGQLFRVAFVAEHRISRIHASGVSNVLSVRVLRIFHVETPGNCVQHILSHGFVLHTAAGDRGGVHQNYVRNIQQIQRNKL